MPVSLHDLVGHRIRREPHLGADIFFNFRALMRKGAHGSRELSYGDILARRFEARPVPAGLLIPNRQLEPERHRLAMNAVRPAYHHRMAILECPFLQHSNQLVEILENQIERFGHLHGQRRIDDVR